MANNKVIDVSYHNGDIDWKKVRSAGYHAIIRCGYGQDFKNQDDKQFKRNADECTRLGIPFGVYLYSYADRVDEAKSEAAHVLRLVKGYTLKYPIFYDVEELRCKNVARSMCETFISEIKKEGYQVGVYASESWWKTCLKGLSCDYRWIAKWSKNAPKLYHAIWQFTSDGSVPGINGRVDLNLSNIAISYNTKSKANKEVNIDTYVKAVYEGKYGNGEIRKKKLGNLYTKVQKRINEVETLVKDTLKGKYGNGEIRKKKLGKNYSLVQWIINRRNR